MAAKEQAEQQLLWDMQHAPHADLLQQQFLLRRTLHLWTLAHSICLQERVAEARRQQTWQQVSSWLGELQQSPDAHPKHGSATTVPADDAWLGELQQSVGNEHAISTGRADDLGDESGLNGMHQSGQSQPETFPERRRRSAAAVSGEIVWPESPCQPLGQHARMHKSSARSQPGNRWMLGAQQSTSSSSQASMKQNWSANMVMAPGGPDWESAQLKAPQDKDSAGSLVEDEKKDDGWLADLLNSA